MLPPGLKSNTSHNSDKSMSAIGWSILRYVCKLHVKMTSYYLDECGERGDGFDQNVLLPTNKINNLRSPMSQFFCNPP